MKLYHITDNRATAVAIKDIPVVEYVDLYNDLKERMCDVRYHVGHYFAVEIENGLKFYLLLLDEQLHGCEKDELPFSSLQVHDIFLKLRKLQKPFRKLLVEL